MDDFPAGPACQGPRRPPLSVIIPVRDGGADFERILRGLRASSFPDFELIVVDDGSTDDSAAIAESQHALVLRHSRPLGPAASRNAGARIAAAPVLFFLDADVLVHHDTVAQVARRFAADPTLAALFGSYDDQPAAPGLVSQFRNLLHHYVHQTGQFSDDQTRPAHTFWTGCGAIRRDILLACGGFDPQLYRTPAIEDIELGYRLTDAGHRILLARDVQVTHFKRWTLASMVQTDILHRGIPWMTLLLRSNTRETDLNVSSAQRASVAATGLALLAAPLAVFSPLALVAALVCIGLIVALNARFYAFLARARGPVFALAAMPLHWLYFFCCGISVAAALALRLLLPPEPEPTHADAPSAVPRPKSLTRGRPRWIRQKR